MTEEKKKNEENKLEKNQKNEKKSKNEDKINEDNKIIEIFLDLLESHFAQEDQENKENEEEIKKMNEVTEKIALENLEEENTLVVTEAEKEGGINGHEDQNEDEENHLEKIPALPPGIYAEVKDCENSIKEFALLHGYAIVRRRSTAGRCDRHVFYSLSLSSSSSFGYRIYTDCSSFFF